MTEQYPRFIRISRVGTLDQLEAFRAKLAVDNIQLTVNWTQPRSIFIPEGTRRFKITLTFPDASAYTLWTLKYNG